MWDGTSAEFTLPSSRASKGFRLPAMAPGDFDNTKSPMEIAVEIERALKRKR